MGLLKAYLNALPDEARDRVLTAQNWCSNREIDYQGDRCLIGHTEDWRRVNGHRRATFQPAVDLRLSYNDRSYLVANRFDRLVERRGLTAAVALIKRHAGARVPALAPGELVG